MAGYECSLCSGQEQATLLITPLAGGETMAVGESCMAVAFVGMLAGHLEVDPDPLYQAVEKVQQAAIREAASGASEGPAPGSADTPDSGPKAPPAPAADGAPKAPARTSRRRPQAARSGAGKAGGQ